MNQDPIGLWGGNNLYWLGPNAACGLTLRDWQNDLKRGNSIVRSDFGNWRREYWKYRARKELRRRDLKVGKSY